MYRSTLTSLIKGQPKEKIIGDAEEDELEVEEVVQKQHSHNTPGNTGDTIEEQHLEEDSLDPEVPLSELIAADFYKGIVDQMIVSIMNASFHDIRAYRYLDSSAEHIIDNAVDYCVRQVAEDTLEEAQEVEEEKRRLREGKHKATHILYHNIYSRSLMCFRTVTLKFYKL